MLHLLDWIYLADLKNDSCKLAGITGAFYSVLEGGQLEKPDHRPNLIFAIPANYKL